MGTWPTMAFVPKRTVLEYKDECYELTYQCAACGGTGMAVPDCEACSGNGWVDDPSDGGTMMCPECDGDKCDICGGSGEVPTQQANLPALPTAEGD